MFTLLHETGSNGLPPAGAPRRSFHCGAPLIAIGPRSANAPSSATHYACVAIVAHIERRPI